MRLPLVSSLVIVMLGLMVCATQREVISADGKTPGDDLIVTKVYRVADLPVWTSEKQCDPAVLMRLIQASVSPSDWHKRQGDSTMAADPKNASIVVSTRSKNHDKIVDLLRSMRHKE